MIRTILSFANYLKKKKLVAFKPFLPHYYYLEVNNKQLKSKGQIIYLKCPVQVIFLRGVHSISHPGVDAHSS